MEQRGPDECWPWTGHIHTSTGYGAVVRDGHEWSAHRYGYFLAHGDIPPDSDVDHICRNRACQNPRHLRLLPHDDHGRVSAYQRYRR